MKKFKVVIEETIAQEFLIDAATEEDATEKAIQMYKNKELILEGAECQHTQISVNNSEWFEI
ncbi:MAG: hypothetical protein IJZ63_04225 [Clostridia bacterium]|nr:hypothetical protein [Clostridia bacterium]